MGCYRRITSLLKLKSVGIIEFGLYKKVVIKEKRHPYTVTTTVDRRCKCEICQLDQQHWLYCHKQHITVSMTHSLPP